MKTQAGDQHSPVLYKIIYGGHKEDIHAIPGSRST